jgi:hypothetical protein
MEFEDMVQKLQQARELLGEVYDAMGDHVINRFRIEDWVDELSQGIDEVINLVQIEMI